MSTMTDNGLSLTENEVYGLARAVILRGGREGWEVGVPAGWVIDHLGLEDEQTDEDASHHDVLDNDTANRLTYALNRATVTIHFPHGRKKKTRRVDPYADVKVFVNSRHYYLRPNVPKSTDTLKVYTVNDGHGHTIGALFREDREEYVNPRWVAVASSRRAQVEFKQRVDAVRYLAVEFDRAAQNGESE